MITIATALTGLIFAFTCQARSSDAWTTQEQTRYKDKHQTVLQSPRKPRAFQEDDHAMWVAKDLEESNSSEEGEELWLAEKSETEGKENAGKVSVSRASQHKKYDLDTFEDDLDHDASEESKKLGRFNDKMLNRLMIGAIAASSATISLTVLIFLLYKWRQNKIKKSKDRHRRRMSLTSDGQLGDTCKIQNYRKFDSSLTKSCPDIVIGNNQLKRGVRMDPVEVNMKSELMREVDLLGVVQEKIVTKLSGFRSELATQESGEVVKIMPETFNLRRLILPWTEDSFSEDEEEQKEEDKEEEHKEEEEKKEKDKEKEKEDKKAAGWRRQTILPSISWI